MCVGVYQQDSERRRVCYLTGKKGWWWWVKKEFFSQSCLHLIEAQTSKEADRQKEREVGFIEQSQACNMITKDDHEDADDDAGGWVKRMK